MEPFSRSSTTSSPLAALQRSSGLLTSQSWFPIDPWREKVFNFKDTARSYVLVEARLYKNEYNVEHEFVMGEFRAGSNIIFVAAERVTNLKDSDHKMSDEECHRVLQEIKAEDERKREQKGKRKRKDDKSTPNIPKLKKSSGHLFSRASTSDSSSIFSLSPGLGEHTMRADDKIRLILEAEDFDAAVKIVEDGRAKKAIFSSRGSLKYRSDTKPSATSTSVSADPTLPRPTLLNFTSAVVAIQRSKPYYTVGRKNCYWFATGMMFILSQKFTPFEPIEFDVKQGTWSFGLITIPLGGLEKGEEGALLRLYNRAMQEMELKDLPPKTEQERLAEQARDELEQQLNETNRLVSEAKDRFVQAEKKETDAKISRAQADLKVSEAKSKVDRLALQADFEAKEEERERERLAFEAKMEAERSEREREIRELQAQVKTLISSHSKG